MKLGYGCSCCSVLSSISFIDNSVFLCFSDRTSVVYCRFKGYGKVGSSQLVSELRFSEYLGSVGLDSLEIGSVVP